VINTMGKEIFRADGFPTLQNKTYDTAASARACPVGDVVLLQDEVSGIIHNASFDPKIIDYDESYQNEQAHSKVFKNHINEVTEIVRNHFDSLRLLEVGCGKAYFLEHLLKQGFDILGVDPAYEGENPRVSKSHFDASLGLRGDAIILRHVLEHVPRPIDFLDSIRQANGGGGKIYIEVPCFDWISEQHAWFDIFYEHVNYFRLADFTRIFKRVLTSGHIFGGQYLFIVADLSSLNTSNQSSLPAFKLPQQFFQGIEQASSLVKVTPTNVIWGGSSKGVIFSHHLQRAGAHLDFAIDINPAKQGRFLPSTGLQVLSPQAAISKLPKGANIFIMNCNYRTEITETGGPDFNYISIPFEKSNERA
jgi:SAM-dependent methyltransferase